ncbi:hypothetical protein [Celeribacter persicus]|uniref:Uncharacterized protein n=1 Tax=Celeribacter persicus TaxID=1651082 RepID=A0A2T5HK31_9RHOB|nr:hypothetical protein [Celeribacter persicus]PTQ71943.1 hypothetical protein C8N42_107122 [Celeribacter persicus]
MMKRMICAAAMLAMSATPVFAEWHFSEGRTPNAFSQANNMTLELQCDRIRFAPADYADSKDIIAKQGISIQFMKDGKTEAGSFQVGRMNASVELVDNYPVEIRFQDAADYNFVLDQIAANAVLKLSMADQDVSYGIFDLTGSAAAIRSLRAACSGSRLVAPKPAAASMEAPEGIVYCGGGAMQRQIEYLIRDKPKDQWDAVVTVNGEQIRAMTSYSYFGNSEPPRGFVVALLGEDRSEFLVFHDSGKDWLEFGDYRYDKCN